MQAKDLQEKLEFAGGGKIQQQKAVVEKLQKVLFYGYRTRQSLFPGRWTQVSEVVEVGCSLTSCFLPQDIDKKSTAINKKKVQISTSSKTIKTLEKAIETTNVEKAKSLQDKEQKTAEFKEIESKAFALQEEFSKKQEVTALDFSVGEGEPSCGK